MCGIQIGTRKYLIRVITKLPNTEQSSKGKVKTHKSRDKISQQPENWENHKLGRLGTSISKEMVG